MIEAEKTFLDEFLDNPYMDELSNPFGTKEEKKERNKRINIEVCRKKYPYIIGPDGNLSQIVLKCKYFRDCEPCRFDKFQDEIEPRLNYAQNHIELDDMLYFDTITEKQRGAYFKKLSRGEYQYYCFPQPDDMLIVVHNNSNGSGNKLWDFGYDDHDLHNEDNGLDLNFFTILRDVPEGKKISGSLGKKQEDEPEESTNGSQIPEEEETYQVKKPFLYKAGLSERDANHAYKLALAQTLDINVTNEIELEAAWFERINAMAKEIKGVDVGFTWDSVTVSDIKLWNANPNNFSKNTRKVDLNNQNVQISTNSDTYSRNLDILPDANHKKPFFQAVIDRANRNDGLDDERQQAIQDYLYHHGT